MNFVQNSIQEFRDLTRAPSCPSMTLAESKKHASPMRETIMKHVAIGGKRALIVITLAMSQLIFATALALSPAKAPAPSTHTNVTPALAIYLPTAKPPAFYDAPYRDTNAYFDDGSSSTVQEQVQKDWSEYIVYWGVSPDGPLQCSYTFTPYNNGKTTGRFGGIAYTGQCRGGDTVYGTLQCPKGYKLVGDTCKGGKVAIEASPPTIPSNSRVKNDHVLTKSELSLSLTNAGQPQADTAVALQSNRGSEDVISQPGPTNASGQARGSVKTRVQPGRSVITSASATIETAQAADISWLPAKYQNSFLVTCYVIALEANYLNTKMVVAPGIPNKKFRKGFLAGTKLNGTGEALDGTYIHYKGNDSYMTLPKPCAPTKTGACAVDAVTAAVDPSVIPLKSTISISSEGYRVALDIGGGINDYHIDLFYGTRLSDCLQLGKSYGHTVRLESYGN